MKGILISYIMVVLFATDKLDYLDEALSDFKEKSCFIVVKVKLAKSSTTKTYIIENDDLYLFLNEKKTKKEADYTSYMRRKIENNKPLKLKSLSRDFREVIESDVIESDAQKGLDHFVKTYFDSSGVLKNNSTAQENALIIKKMFDWGVLCSIDDETGYWYMHK